MIPVDVSFRGLKHSDSVVEQIEKKVEKLERHNHQLIRCHVTVSIPHRNHHKGNIYHIHIHLEIPGNDLIISREPEKNAAHEEISVAIRDAFNALDRQLRNRFEKMQKKRSA